MAATTKNQELISLLKGSKAPVPWCHEFEKMISGMNFHAPNAPLMLHHKFAIVKAIHNFNNVPITSTSTFVSLKQDRIAIAGQILGSLGTGVSIEAPFFCIWGCNIFIGDGVYINRSVEIHDNAPVQIGNNVLIGPNVSIITATHDTNVEIRGKGGSHAFPIVIEDDCWIGANVTILPGVKVKRGTTIAAGAVVGKDVKENVIAGGVPAKILRHLEE